jgi:hypothetical protein
LNEKAKAPKVGSLRDRENISSNRRPCPEPSIFLDLTAPLIPIKQPALLLAATSTLISDRDSSVRYRVLR